MPHLQRAANHSLHFISRTGFQSRESADLIVDRSIVAFSVIFRLLSLLAGLEAIKRLQTPSRQAIAAMGTGFIAEVRFQPFFIDNFRDVQIHWSCEPEKLARPKVLKVC
jgi:hypothetical protein